MLEQYRRNMLAIDSDRSGPGCRRASETGKTTSEPQRLGRRFQSTWTAIGSPDKREGSRILRREFIAGLGSAVAWPVAARAQQGKPVAAFMSRGLAMRHEKSSRKDGSKILEGSHHEAQ